MYSQHNLEALYNFIGSLDGQQCLQTPNYSYVITPNNAWPNLIFNVDFPKEELNHGIDQLIQNANSIQLPPTIMGGQMPNNSPTFKTLESLNFRSGEWYAMYHDVKTRSTSTNDAVISIHEVKNNEQLNDWYGIIYEVLMQRLPTNRAIIEALYNKKDCYLFLGQIDDKSVATSLLFIEDQTAGIYFVATEESHRKKGYGAALTKVAMQKARDLGCSQVELQATNAGKPVYQKLGFEVSGTLPLFQIKKTKT